MSTASRSPLILIGAGGHAKVLVDCMLAANWQLDGYVDDESKPWLEALGAPRLTESQLENNLKGARLVIGFVGLSCAALQRRLEIMKDYESKGATFPVLAHPSAIVSTQAQIGAGVQILPGAIINSHAVIGEGAVINTAAVVEHDASIEAGVHMAPRSVALGASKIGRCAYIGSGAVIIQNVSVEPAEFVKALAVRGG